MYMNLYQLLTLLSETESKTRQRKILEQHRELLNEEFIEGGTQQVEAWTKEGRHAEALQLSEGLVTACTVVEELSQLRGKTLVAKAKALESAQFWDDAMEVYAEARRRFEDGEDKEGIADCDLGQGRIYYFRSDFHKALAHFQRAQVVFEKLGIKKRAAECVNSRGAVHAFRGEYDDALNCYKQAQAVFEKLGIKNSTANCIMNQGLVHCSRGEYDDALACYKQVQAVYEELAIRHRVALCLQNEGEVHLSRGEYDDALVCLKQAQTLYEELGMKDWATNCMVGQGIAHYSRCEYDDALARFKQAQALYEELGVKDMAMESLRCKGDVYRLRGEHDTALQCYTQAKEERPIEELWYPETQWQVQHGIAKLYQSDPKALDYYDECIAIIDTLRGRQQTDWTKMGILYDKEDVYAEAILRCIDRKVEDAKYLSKAFNYTERAKARALLDLIDQTQPVLKSENQQVQTRLIQLRQSQTEQQRLREAEQLSEAAELSATIRQEQEELAELSFEDASLTIGRVRNIETIQKALPKDGALVEFYYQGETQVAFLLTNGNFQAFTLQLDTVLPNLPRLRQAIQHRELLHEVQAVLAELFDVLFKRSGIWNHLKGFERLILVPHGELHGVPFAALYDKEGKQYLIEQKILSVVPSASILDICRTKNPNRRESCLWVYAPKTKPDSELSPDEKMLEELMKEHGKPSEELSKIFKKLQPVTGTEVTIEGITESLREFPWDVVHFYCHADAHLDNPMLSYIALSDTSCGSAQVASLRAMDIFNLPLHASLVVLGACQTGVGARRPGDDIVSLTRAFFRAGTPSVLASLWRVPGRATADLFKYFYLDEDFGWLSGADKAIALQAAQREILLGEPHPYYWAGFVLYGDWS